MSVPSIDCTKESNHEYTCSKILVHNVGRGRRRRVPSGQRHARAGAATFQSEGKDAFEVHDRGAATAAEDLAVCRQAGLRGSQARLHRCAALPQDHERHGRRGLEHGQLGLSAEGKGLRQHPSVAAAAGAAQHGIRTVRGRPRHLPGARLRPRQHLVHQGQDRLDRDRSADGQGDVAGRTEVRQREAWRAPGRGRHHFALPRRPLRRHPRRRG